ncbi:MAG: OmpA family protein [Acidimicrobiales bacterium]
MTGGCSIAGTAPNQIVTFTSSTPCNITASVPASTDYAASSSSPQTVTAGLDSQTISVPTTSTAYNGSAYSVTLTASGFSGTGAVNYTVVAGGTASGCTISNSTLQATSSGYCNVTATIAADGTYSAATSSPSAQTFTLATPTVTITSTAPTSPTVNSNYTPVATSSSGVTPTFSVTGGCSIAGTAPDQVVTFTSTTPCAITASVPASTDYAASSSSPQTVTAGLDSQTISVPTSSTPYNGSAYSVTLTSIGFSGTGAVYYTVVAGGTASGCTISNSTLQATSSGYCNVTATIAADGTYLSATSTPSAQTFTQATPTVSFTSTQPSSPTIGSTYTPTAVSSAGLPVTFGVSGGCTLNGGVVTFTSATPCVIMASTPVTPNYFAALATPSQTTTAVVNSQSTLVVPSTSTPFNGTTYTVTLSSTGGSGTGMVTYALANNSTATQCSIDNSTLTATTYGVCYVTATKAGDGTYGAVTSAPSAQTFTQATPTVSFTSTQPSSPTIGSTYTPTAISSAGLPVTFGVSGGCSLSGGVVTFTGTTPCVVMASTQVTSNYFAALASPPQTITAGLSSQSITVPATTTDYDGTGFSVTLTSSGYSGTGMVSYTLANGSTASGCSISQATLIATSPGYCNVTATITADSTYNTATSAPSAQTFDLATPTVTITSTAPSLPTTNSTYTPVATSSSGVTPVFSVTGGCSISGVAPSQVVTFTSSTPCDITASVPAATGYNAASSSPQTVTAGLTSQTISVPTTSTVYNGATFTVNLTSSGYSGTGMISYALASSPLGTASGCSVSGATLIATSSGTCFVTATITADSMYSATTSAASAQTFTQATPTVSFTSTPSSSPTIGSTYTPTAVSSAGLPVTYSVSGGCSLSGGVVTFTSTTPCNITASSMATSGYAAASSSPQTFSAGLNTQAITVPATTTAFNGVTYTVILTSSGFSGTGAVNYTVVAGGTASGCTVSISTLQATSSGTCDVTATIAADSTYATATSATSVQTFILATPTVTITSSVPSSPAINSTYTPVATSSSGATPDFSVTGGCSIAGVAPSQVVTFTSSTPCAVTASVPQSGGYNAASSSPQTITPGSSGGGGGGGGSPSTPVISTLSLPSTVTGAVYAAPINETGGVAPFVWTATGLPAGLSIDATGDIVGTVSAPAGSYSVTVTVSDSNGARASQGYTLVVGTGLVVANATLPNATVGQSYNEPLTEQGGTGTSSWACAGLPAGLTCSTGGVISGTPTVSGTFNVTLTVNNGGQSATVTLPLTVNASSTSGLVSNLSALPGDGEVLVTWSAPSGATSSQGLSYTVTLSPGAATCTTSTTSCLIEGLTNGTPYAISVVATTTSPAATSAASTLTNEVPTPNPIVAGPSGTGVVATTLSTQLSPGLASATQLNGSTTTASVAVGNTDIVVSGAGLSMTISASSTVSTPTGFTIVLVQGGTAHVSGSGFYPGSLVDVYLAPGSTLLGAVRVGPNGTYLANLAIPSTISAGDHTLLSQGYVKSGKRASESVGVVVDSSNEAFLLLFPFAVGSAALTPTMQSQIRTFAAKLKAIGATSIVITGYTDIAGGAAYNLNLGHNRALSVELYLQTVLIADGVTTSIKMTTLSLGSTAPAASNNTLAGRARNRNVTVMATLL